MPKTNCCCEKCGDLNPIICQNLNCECHKNVCCSNCMSYHGGCVMPDCRCHNGGASCHGGEKFLAVHEVLDMKPLGKSKKMVKVMPFPQPPAEDWSEIIRLEEGMNIIINDLLQELTREAEK